MKQFTSCKPRHRSPCFDTGARRARRQARKRAMRGLPDLPEKRRRPEGAQHGAGRRAKGVSGKGDAASAAAAIDSRSATAPAAFAATMKAVRSATTSSPAGASSASLLASKGERGSQGNSSELARIGFFDRRRCLFVLCEIRFFPFFIFSSPFFQPHPQLFLVPFCSPSFLNMASVTDADRWLREMRREIVSCYCFRSAGPLLLSVLSF